MKHPPLKKGQGNLDLREGEFKARARQEFQGPEFQAPRAIEQIVASQWQRYDESRKYAATRPAGRGMQKPKLEVGIEWLDTRAKLVRAQRDHDRKGAHPRVLVINGSPRSDRTCPGEMSKTHRLCELAMRKLRRDRVEVEYLDLSRVTAEYGRQIHPCKGCVSTAMPLCHWPCSCYPNHALGQIQDWMHEIYEMWVRAHGVIIITPVHWYSVPSVLKLMMDRLVCADGGNPDYTSTEGKNAALAKSLELRGWDYPRHLAGRAFSVVVHGDAEGALTVKEGLAAWLRDMGLVSAGNQAELDRYIGYYEPYATSHAALDRDRDLHDEVLNATELTAFAVKEILRYPRNLAPGRSNEAIRKK